MEQKYLIVNPGSASKKYALYQSGVEKLFAHFEQVGELYEVTIKNEQGTRRAKISSSVYEDAVSYFLNVLRNENYIGTTSELAAVGIRVVAPGTNFAKHQLIDEKFRQELTERKENAPLHIVPLLAEIEHINKHIPRIKMVGISDSAFHATIPPANKHYAIPLSDTAKLDLYRFGYHGISVQSLLPKIKVLVGNIPRRVIVCHLGSGASVTAVKNGQSLDTSMGYTPLEGLIMATRVGDIDAGALLKLARSKNMNFLELEEYLNSQSGLLGLSEQSDDIRELLELENNNDDKAKLALLAYVNRVKKYIGAYCAVLNGLDLLVFTATVGERSSIIRGRICANLDGLGINLDENKNEQIVNDKVISSDQSPVSIAVIPTNEMRSIADQTAKLLD